MLVAFVLILEMACVCGDWSFLGLDGLLEIRLDCRIWNLTECMVLMICELIET